MAISSVENSCDPVNHSAPLFCCCCLFCDFDGPLVDVSDRYYSTYKLSLQKIEAFYRARGETLNLRQLTKKQFWQMKQERVCDDEIAMGSGLRGEQIEFFLQHVRQIVNHPELLPKDKMQPGANWALALLHSRGVKLVLVTLRCKWQAANILTNYGLKRLFTGIYGSQDANLAYQNNIQAKTKLLKLAVSENADKLAYMVGDTEADILAAKEAGIGAIAVTCGIRSFLYLEQFEPEKIVEDLLCGARHLLKRSKLNQYSPIEPPENGKN